MKRVMAGIRKTDAFFYAVAGVVLIVMVLVTLFDVILRNFGHPITGSMEIIQYGGALVFGFSVPYATFLKAQVQVDLVTEKLKPKVQKTVTILTRLAGLFLFLFICYNFFMYGLDVMKTGELSPSFKIPYYPIVFSLSLSFLLQSLTIFLDLMEVIQGKNDDSNKEGAA